MTYPKNLKKQIQVTILLLGLIFTIGCQKNQSQSTNTAVKQELNTQQEIKIDSELSKYGAKTEKRKGINDSPQLNSPEIGSGKLFNDASDKSSRNLSFTNRDSRKQKKKL